MTTFDLLLQQTINGLSLGAMYALLALGLFVVGTNAFVIAGLLPDIASTLGVRPADAPTSEWLMTTPSWLSTLQWMNRPKPWSRNHSSRSGLFSEPISGSSAALDLRRSRLTDRRRNANKRSVRMKNPPPGMGGCPYDWRFNTFKMTPR